MEKIVLLSFDDGTVYDEALIALLNRYHIPATFNLNSGLADYVWYFEGAPIRRLQLDAGKHIYRGHEIASHTVHHPCLTELSQEDLQWQIEEDCRALRQIFGMDEIGFAVPFTACGPREIDVLRRHVRYARLSQMRDGFALPEDAYHICINALYNDPDVYEKIRLFSQSTLPVSVFVLCGHSYEPEVLGQWEDMERLLRHLCSFPDFRFMTTMEFVKEYL